MSASLKRRVELLEAAHAAARELREHRRAHGIPDLEASARLASLLAICDPQILAVTARARSVYELVGMDMPSAPQITIRPVDRDAIEQARQAHAEATTAKLHAEAVADAAARREIELAQPVKPPARAKAQDWFSQFEPSRSAA